MEKILLTTENITNVANAWSSYQSSKGVLDSIRAQVKAAEIANEGITLEYESGTTRTTLEVIQSRSILLNSKINFNVGYNNILRVGDKVDSSLPLLSVFINSEDDYDNVSKKIQDCFVITDSEVSELPHTYEVIN